MDDSAGNEFRLITHHHPQRCLFFVVMYPTWLYILSERDNANLVYSPNPAAILIDDLCHWTSSPGASLGAAKYSQHHLHIPISPIWVNYMMRCDAVYSCSFLGGIITNKAIQSD